VLKEVNSIFPKKMEPGKVEVIDVYLRHARELHSQPPTHISAT